jgi:hypothetical protein
MKTLELFYFKVLSAARNVKSIFLLLAFLASTANLNADTVKARFYKGAGNDATDLHVEFSSTISSVRVVDALGNATNPANPGPFTSPPAGIGTAKIDFAGGMGAAGGTKAPSNVGATETYYEFNSGGSPLKIRKWWWTKDGEKQKKKAGDSALFVPPTGSEYKQLSFASVSRPNNLLPPSPFRSIPGEAITFPGNIALRNVVHSNLAPQGPPPPLGGTQNYTFNGNGSFEISLDGGATWQSHNAPTTTGVTVHHTSDTDTLEHYDVEMNQLSLSGGTLPPPVIIRESPTLQSLGITEIAPDGGLYQIDSFFDIFFEVSLDGGSSWIPQNSPPMYLVLSDGAIQIPTMTEWALIILGLVLLGVGVVYIKRRQLV